MLKRTVSVRQLFGVPTTYILDEKIRTLFWRPALLYQHLFVTQKNNSTLDFNIGIVFLLSDFINLTQVHNFTVSAQDIFTFRRFSVFTVSFTRILQVLMEIVKRFALYY